MSKSLSTVVIEMAVASYLMEGQQDSDSEYDKYGIEFAVVDCDIWMCAF